MSFHVPESARDTTHPLFGSQAIDGHNGVFDLDSPEGGWRLAMLVSDGEQWEHVSVHAYRPTAPRRRSVQTRTPTWREMAFVKRTFWDPEDVVVQFHPRASEYVNDHPHVLHLWRPTTTTIPTPPAELVGRRP